MNNVDITIQAEAPKVSPHVEPMKAVIASILEINTDDVSIKAKTMEKLGPIGEGKAIAAHAVILIMHGDSQ